MSKVPVAVPESVGSNVDCGFSVDTDTPAVGGDPVGGAVGTVPFLGIFQQRKFQTFKIVDEPNPNAGDPVLYTIKIVNRVAQPVSLTDIRDTLPPGEWVTLTFTAVTRDSYGNPAPEGLYCNEVQVVPGGAGWFETPRLPLAYCTACWQTP